MFTKGMFLTIDGVLHKRCNGCCFVKPFTPEFYPRDISAPRGLHSRCKDCRRAGGKSESQRKASRQWKARNRDRVNAWHQEYRKRRKLALFAAKLR